jgi:hypothetical protein
MGALGLKEECKPATQELPISLEKLAELTGFPVEFIKRELLLDGEMDLSVEELRSKVLSYLDTNF